MTSERSVRRLPVIAVVVALAVVAFRAGDAAPERSARLRTAGDATAMPPAGSRSGAFYCVDGPAPEGSSEFLFLTNTGDTAAPVAVTVMPEGKAAVRRSLEVPPKSMLGVRRNDLTEEQGPTVVEPFSSDVVVEHERVGGGAFVIGPCATRPERTWYFAAGTTLRGVEQWLYLFNPFPHDAVVDISFLTSAGRREPEDLRGLAVPRRSQVVVAVHGAVQRETNVATVVEARVGRVVAEQSLDFTDDSEFSGVTRSLGAVSPALEWYFADGRMRSGARRLVAVANPGDVDAEVDLQVVPTDDTAVEPMALTVPHQGVVVAQLGECGEEPATTCLALPDGLSYSLTVSAATNQPVVVEDLATWTDDDVYTGAASWLGTSRPAEEWLFARSLFTNTVADYLTVFNPGAEPTRFSVAVVAGGSLQQPDGSQRTLGPGARTRIDLTKFARGDGGISITSDHPIVAERTIVIGSAVSRSTGVPRRG